VCSIDRDGPRFARALHLVAIEIRLRAAVGILVEASEHDRFELDRESQPLAPTAAPGFGSTSTSSHVA
jgi:hypothetical protein